MKHYIDKDKVVEELEKLYNLEYDNTSNLSCGKKIILRNIYIFIDTLETKEVDLEEEIKEVKHNYKVDDNRHTSICSADIEWIAEHFFELGLFSTLTWQDIRLIAEIGNDFMNSEESDNLTDEAYYSAILDKVREKGRDAKTSWSENRKARGE